MLAACLCLPLLAALLAIRIALGYRRDLVATETLNKAQASALNAMHEAHSVHLKRTVRFVPTTPPPLPTHEPWPRIEKRLTVRFQAPRFKLEEEE